MLKWHFETTHGTVASGMPDHNTLLLCIWRLLKEPAGFLPSDGQNLDPRRCASNCLQAPASLNSFHSLCVSNVLRGCSRIRSRRTQGISLYPLDQPPRRRDQALVVTTDKEKVEAVADEAVASSVVLDRLGVEAN